MRISEVNAGHPTSRSVGFLSASMILLALPNAQPLHCVAVKRWQMHTTRKSPIYQQFLMAIIEAQLYQRVRLYFTHGQWVCMMRSMSPAHMVLTFRS